ncbi:MAG: (2Fe-2S) ferredoxin domain-containing protein, partial [bacterium]|nr:(2Fe-2S) ferredoxin domain-containing protein [bacterium]
MILDDLNELASKVHEEIAAAKHRIHICVAAGCISSGSDKVLSAFKDEVKKRGWEGKCLVKGVGCLGPCAGGPVVLVDSENVAYEHVAIE